MLFFQVIVIVGVAMGPNLACSDAADSMPHNVDALDAAYEYVSLGKTDCAMQKVNEAIRVDSTRSAAYTLRGWLWRAKKEHKKALLDLDTAIRLSPASADALCARAWVRYDLDCTSDDALNDFSNALRLDPALATGYEGRGLIRLQKNEPDKAIPDLNKAIQLNPALATSYLGRATAWMRKCEPDKALPDLDKAIQLNSALELAYYFRAEIWAGRREHKKAISDLTQYLRISPKVGDALIRRGSSYLEIGDMDNCLKDYDEAIRLDPKNHSALVARANLFKHQKKWDGSIDDCTKAIDILNCICRNDIDLIDKKILASAYFYRSLAWYHKEKWDLAIKDIDECLRVEGDAHDAHAARAMLYATCSEVKFRDPAKALWHAKKACELSKWAEPYSLEAYAAAHAANGEYSAAWKWQKKAMGNTEYVRERGAVSENLLWYYKSKVRFD